MEEKENPKGQGTEPFEIEELDEKDLESASGGAANQNASGCNSGCNTGC
jgi:hypothetical protein